MSEIKRFFEARKLLETKKDGEFEINKFHVIRIEDKKIMDYTLNMSDDLYDYEEAYFKGVIFSFEDIYAIRVNSFLETIKKEFEENKKELSKEEIKEANKIINWFEKYRDYELLIKEEKE